MSLPVSNKVGWYIYSNEKFLRERTIFDLISLKYNLINFSFETNIHTHTQIYAITNNRQIFEHKKMKTNFPISFGPLNYRQR